MVLTLGLGFAAAAIVLGLWYSLFVRPLPFVGHERMTLILGESLKTGRQDTAMSLQLLHDFMEGNQAFEEIAGVSFKRQVTLSTADGTEPLDVTYTTGNYFSMLNIPVVEGRVLQPADDQGPGSPAVMLVSYDLWQNRLGGAPDIVGSRLLINEQPVTVVGVVTPEYRGHYWDVIDAWLPTSTAATLVGDQLWEDRSWEWIQGFGRLRPGVSVEEGDADLDAIAARVEQIYPESEGHRARVHQAQEYYFSNQRDRMNNMAIGAALLLLLCGLNVANLLLTRDTLRSRELAVRSALGAGRVRMIAQIVADSLLIAVAGAGLGTLLAALGGKQLIGISSIPPVTFKAQYLDPPVLLAIFVFGVVLGLALSLVPVVHLLRGALHEPLKRDAGSTSHGARRAMVVLSVVQVAAVVAVLAMAVVLLQGSLAARFGDAGFDADELVVAHLDFRSPGFQSADGGASFLQNLLNEVASRPGIASAALSGSWAIPYAVLRTEVIVEGQATGMDGASISAYRQAVTPEFFEVTGIELVDGETFTYAHGPDTPPVLIVNGLLAERQWPNESAIGKRVRLVRPGKDNSPWWTVIGVVEPSKNRGFAVTVQGRDQDIYLPLLQAPQSAGYLVVRGSGDLDSVGPTLRTAMMELDPVSPLGRVRKVREWLLALSADDTFISAVVTLFGTVALVVAVVGLYGLLVFSVRRRVREIGLRMAVGATPGAIFRLVGVYALKVVLVGLALGWLACFALTRFVFLETPGARALHDPVVLLVVSVGVLVTSLFALWSPVRFATQVQPITALRDE
jgi:putative ABC transport system permease protein